ncbi:MAG: type II methionyl aminopeptidase [Methanobacterium sp.]|jgi:methionyl aminopeptidase
MIEMYEKPGKIVSKVRGMAVNKVKENLKVCDLVEFVEEEIKKLGGEPAFPCNISINEVTAHYTSPLNDESLLNLGDLVKIDLGAQVDGYIADSAVTVLVGGDKVGSDDLLPEVEVEFQFKLIETAQKALENVISVIKDGVELEKIGNIVEDTVNAENLNPVSNLTGHSMDRWILHSGLSIPNVKGENKHKIREGDVLAIEPFVTNGVGRVTDMKEVYIFRFLRDRPLRMVQARKLLDIIKQNYHNLPFAERWVQKSFKGHQFNLAMNQLISSRALYPYHALKEKSDARVAQAEHTVIVEPDGCHIITE